MKKSASKNQTAPASQAPAPAAAPQPPAGAAGGHAQAPAEQGSSTAPAPRILPYVNFQQRQENRALPTDKVLALLRQWMPEQYGLAEVIGKWIWITFPEQPTEKVRGQLSQFGFHWNNLRKCWQHPCGQFTTEGSSAGGQSGTDPRQKYGSRFAADLKAA